MRRRRRRRRGPPAGPGGDLRQRRDRSRAASSTSASSSTPRVATTRAPRGQPRRALPERPGGRRPQVRRDGGRRAQQRRAGLLGQRRPHLHRRQGLRQLPGHRLRGPGRALPAASSLVRAGPAQSEQQNEDGNFLCTRSASTPPTGSPTSTTRATRTSRAPRPSTSPARRTCRSWSRTSSTIAEKCRQAAEQVTPAQLSQLDQLTDIVQSADFDVYTGADDDLLRKIEATSTSSRRGHRRGPGSISVELSRHPQRGQRGAGDRRARPSAQPLGDLLQQFGIDPSQLGQRSGRAAGGGGGCRRPRATTARGATQATWTACRGSGPGRATRPAPIQ